MSEPDLNKSEREELNRLREIMKADDEAWKTAKKQPRDSDEFINRTCAEFDAWRKTFYIPSFLAKGCDLYGQWAWQEQQRRFDAAAAPDEASRAPAPQEQPAKGDDTLGALIDLHGQVSHFCETEGEADFETGRATRAIKAAKAARALLAQSQGGQPATSREQGADHA